ncbi:MAG: oxidoreductase [Planctomycetota bacterium]|jgi:2,4-dienoyl-CoA reductase-like NADH-dependent reductase (Old Yellow Enzyme family)
MAYRDTVFSPITIGSKTAPNRLVSQAMEANDGVDGGKVSELGIKRYRKLARGKWGVVVVEALSISDTSLARINGMIIRRENLESFKQLVTAMREENPDCVILFQISHSGRNSNTVFSEKTTVAPGFEDVGRYLSEDEIQDILDGFVEGSLLAEEAGADGVDFKLCHGYFGAELLRPQNTRDDRWGGSFENRTRFLREGVEAIKTRRKSEDFILGSRISMYEGIRGACGTPAADEIVEDLSEMKRVVALMADLGMDYVNISAGIPGITSEITRPCKGSEYLALHHFRYCKEVKELLRERGSEMKVIGSAYSIYKEEGIDLGGENVERGYTDLFGYGRQSFADPLTPAKLEAGEEVDWCVACSGCTRMMIAQINDGCLLFNPYYKELWKEHQKKK